MKPKIHLLFILILAGVFILNTGCSQKESFKVDLLTCEYLNNPVGIDVNQPRLSWKISVVEDELSFSQKAWQIVASTSHEKLEKGEYDAWDSGKTESDQQHLIPWNGKQLATGDRIFWKVKAWNSEDKESNWSKPAWFTIGPMDENDWHGQWIKYPYKEDEKYTEACFKKEFILEELPEYAEVHIVADGMHELYINGNKVGDRILSPILSSTSRLRYVSYDITPLLKAGPNQIGTVTSIGFFREPKSWITSEYNDDFEPGFMSQLISNGKVILSTNETWKCRLGNQKFYAHQPFLILDSIMINPFGGEKFDAGQPDAVTIFNSVKDGWLKPIASSTPEKKISAESVEPDRVIVSFPPVKIEAHEYKSKPAWRIDFGRNFTGFLDLVLVGNPGAEVTILSSDVEEREVLYNQESMLVLDSIGNGRFRHKFNLCAGRYVTLVGNIEKPLKKNLKALVVSNARNQLGRFECSNELLNEIFETDVWTYLANTFNAITVDCPHRERRGYGVEGGMANIGVGLPVFESGAFITKWLEDWRDVQDSNGYFPHCAPRDDAGGGPLWSMAPTFLTYYGYQYYQDKKLLNENYPAIRHWMEFIHSQLKDDGTLSLYDGDWRRLRGLGDWGRPHPGEWPRPGVSLEAIGKRREMGITDAAQHYNNCAYAWNLMLAVELAKTLDKVSDVEKYSERLNNLRQAIHNKYFNNEDKVYIDTDQMRQAFPLFTDIPPESERQNVLNSLLDDINGAHPYFDTGNATHLLIRILTEKLERPDIVTRILLREEYPGYADLLKNGATTWPEYWDFAKSNIHTTYTGVSYWFINGLCGIRPDPENPGFQKFILKPHVAPQLEWAEASYESPYGKIISKWEKKENDIYFHFRVPPNSVAKITLPVKEMSSVLINDQQVNNASEFKIVGEVEGGIMIEVPSGNYHCKTIN